MSQASKIKRGSVVSVIKTRLASKTWRFPAGLWGQELVGLVLKRDKFGCIWVRLFNKEQREYLTVQQKGNPEWARKDAGFNGEVLKLELIDVTFLV